jgi:hypothetical protein
VANAAFHSVVICLRRGRYPEIVELVELARLIGDDQDFSEIADHLSVARCTVSRWLNLVRRI